LETDRERSRVSWTGRWASGSRNTDMRHGKKKKRGHPDQSATMRKKKNKGRARSPQCGEGDTSQRPGRRPPLRVRRKKIARTLEKGTKIQNATDTRVHNQHVWGEGKREGGEVSYRGPLLSQKARGRLTLLMTDKGPGEQQRVTVQWGGGGHSKNRAEENTFALSWFGIRRSGQESDP